MPDKDIETDNFDSFDIPENEVSLGELGIEKYDADYISFNLAGLNSRALAFFIDLALISVVALLAFGAGIYFVNDSNIEPYNLRKVSIPIYLLLFFLGSAYFVILHGYGGKTIGKMLLGIRLITEQGNTVGFLGVVCQMDWLLYINCIFIYRLYLVYIRFAVPVVAR